MSLVYRLPTQDLMERVLSEETPIHTLYTNKKAQIFSIPEMDLVLKVRIIKGKLGFGIFQSNPMNVSYSNDSIILDSGEKLSLEGIPLLNLYTSVNESRVYGKLSNDQRVGHLLRNYQGDFFAQAVDTVYHVLVLDQAKVEHPKKVKLQANNRGFSPSDIRKEARKLYLLGQAVQDLNQRGLVHTDLKPENLFLGADQVTVIDFDRCLFDEDSEDVEIDAFRRSLVVSQYLRETVFGTIEYMSPEQLNLGDLSNTDLWSLGIVVAELLTYDSKRFFEKEDTYGKISEIKKYEGLLNRINKALKAKRVPADLQEAINQLLQKDSSPRDIEPYLTVTRKMAGLTD